MSQHRTRPDAGWHDGPKLTACRYCGGPLPKGRRTFCSGAKARFGRDRVTRARTVVVPGAGCVQEFCIRSQPAYVRKLVEVRDGRVCALCGARAASSEGWHMDHTIPVVEGGGEVGLEGLRTLCVTCHRRETAKLVARRAEQRRAAKERA